MSSYRNVDDRLVPPVAAPESNELRRTTAEAQTERANKATARGLEKVKKLLKESRKHRTELPLIQSINKVLRRIQKWLEELNLEEWKSFFGGLVLEVASSSPPVQRIIDTTSTYNNWAIPVEEPRPIYSRMLWYQFKRLDDLMERLSRLLQAVPKRGRMTVQAVAPKTTDKRDLVDRAARLPNVVVVDVDAEAWAERAAEAPAGATVLFVGTPIDGQHIVRIPSAVVYLIGATNVAFVDALALHVVAKRHESLADMSSGRLAGVLAHSVEGAQHASVDEVLELLEAVPAAES